MNHQRVVAHVGSPSFVRRLLGDTAQPYSVAVGCDPEAPERPAVFLQIRSARGLSLPETVEVGAERVPLVVREGFPQARLL